MRKNKSVLTAVILGASLLLAGCNGLGGANSAAYIANEEEIEAAMDEMSDDLGSSSRSTTRFPYHQKLNRVKNEPA